MSLIFRDAPTTRATRIHWAREELGIDLSLFENAQACSRAARCGQPSRQQCRPEVLAWTDR
jgi:hypothetical protein